MKFLAGIYCAGAHVDNLINFSERAASQFSFTNIDRILSGSEGLTRLCGSRVAVDSKHIERKSAIIKEIFYLPIIFGFACVAVS